MNLASNTAPVASTVAVERRDHPAQDRMPHPALYPSEAPAKCRAPCGLWEVAQSKFAHAACLGLSTVVDFEKERRHVSDEAVEAIRTALHAALQRPRRPAAAKSASPLRLVSK
jgi:hypothetical protein